MGSHQVPVNKFLLHTIEGSAKNGDYEAGTNALDQEGYWPHFVRKIVLSSRIFSYAIARQLFVSINRSKH